MNREEAKLILQAYRPGGQDAGDPQFAEALALAKTDPELAAWFARQQKFDALISREIKSLPAPPDLKEKILALENPQRQKTIELPAPAWWRNLFSFNPPVTWAMTAAVFILCGIVIFWKQPENSVHFANYSAQMVYAAVNDSNHVDVENKNMKQIVAWLGEHHGENNFVLPVALNGDSGLVGCRVLDWHGQKVSMLCYGLSGSGHVDLFVANSNIFPDAPPEDKPQFVSSGGMPTASWSHDGEAYLMVGHGDMGALEMIFQPKAAARRQSPVRASFMLAGISNFQTIYLE
jgi:anti-sigma factor RsiW